MIEKGLPIDCVLYADTGMEFPEMEAHLLADGGEATGGIVPVIREGQHDCQQPLCFQRRYPRGFELGQFKKDWSVARLEERFAREDAADTAYRIRETRTR
mgnify:CR=1 FL=1